MDAVKLIGCLGHSRTLQSFCVCISLREMQHSPSPRCLTRESLFHESTPRASLQRNTFGQTPSQDTRPPTCGSLMNSCPLEGFLHLFRRWERVSGLKPQSPRGSSGKKHVADSFSQMRTPHLCGGVVSLTDTLGGDIPLHPVTPWCGVC